jgi:hypothetical protein
MRGGGKKRDLRVAYAKTMSTLFPTDLFNVLSKTFLRESKAGTFDKYIQKEEENHQKFVNEYNEDIAEKHSTIKSIKSSLPKMDTFGRKETLSNIKRLQKEVDDLNKGLIGEIKHYSSWKNAVKRFVNMPRVEGSLATQMGSLSLDIPEGEAIPQSMPVIEAYRGAEERDPAMLRVMAENEQKRSGRGLSRGKNVGIMRKIVLFR